MAIVVSITTDYIQQSGARHVYDREKTLCELRITKAKRAAVTLFCALLASVIYSVAFTAISSASTPTMEGSVAIRNAVTLALVLVAPFELIIFLWRTGVRPPMLVMGGLIGIVVMIACVIFVLLLPVFVALAINWLSQTLSNVLPFIPSYALTLAFELIPVFQLVYIVGQIVLAFCTRSGGIGRSGGAGAEGV